MENFLLYFRTKLNPPARLFGILLLLLVTAGMSYGQSASIKKIGPEHAAPGDKVTCTITSSDTGDTLSKNAYYYDQHSSVNRDSNDSLLNSEHSVSLVCIVIKLKNEKL